MNAILKIDLRENELNAFDGLKRYLIESKHSTVQKRTYTKSGQFHYYDLGCLEKDSINETIISLFQSGPEVKDFYFNLIETDCIHAQIFKSSHHPENFEEMIRERILDLGKTALERLESLNVSHPVVTPYGFSVWATVGKKGTIKNLNKAVEENIFTEDLRNYAVPRNFCVKYRLKN